MSVNKWIGIGRLGGDVEMRYSPDGKAVASFSVATSEKWTKDGEKQEKTTWHNITVFGKLAEICGQYLKKGDQVYLEGRIQNRSYEKDGVTKYISEIVVNQMQMLGGGDKKKEEELTDNIPF